MTYDEGFYRIEAWSDGREIVVLGSPKDEAPEDDGTMGHNCDAMGCGQDHVIARITLDTGDLPQRVTP